MLCFVLLEHATLSSDGFCVVKVIIPGGPVDISGYERSNGEVRRVQVGDWLLRVNDVSCRYMSRDEIKRCMVGPEGTKIVVVFTSRHDPASTSIRLKYTFGIMMRREASATDRETETDQTASQTEAKDVETRTGAGRE